MSLIELKEFLTKHGIGAMLLPQQTPQEISSIFPDAEGFIIYHKDGLLPFGFRSQVLLETEDLLIYASIKEV
jgi:hypothetical protein